MKFKRSKKSEIKMTVIDENRFDIYAKHINNIRHNLLSRDSSFRSSLDQKLLMLIINPKSKVLLRSIAFDDNKSNIKTSIDYFIELFNSLTIYYKAYRHEDQIEIKCYSRNKTNRHLKFTVYKRNEEIKYTKRIETLSILHINPSIVYNTIYMLNTKLNDEKRVSYKCYVPSLDMTLFSKK